MTRAASVLGLALAAFLAGVARLPGGRRRPRGASPPAPPGFGGAPPSFADVVARVNPAVVHVDVIEDATDNPHEGIVDAPALDVPRRGEGSGFIVDPDGYILTNHHLVPGPGRIRVRLADRRELPARLVGSDPSTDLALLKVEATGLPIGAARRLRPPARRATGCARSATRSSSTTRSRWASSPRKGRKIWNQSFDAYIQTDAAINPGNSGGPARQRRGRGGRHQRGGEQRGAGHRLRGAHQRRAGRARASSATTAGCERGYLGIQLHELDPDLARMIGLGDARGALVVDVVDGRAGGEGGPAALGRDHEPSRARRSRTATRWCGTISALRAGHGGAARASSATAGRSTVAARLDERGADDEPAEDERDARRRRRRAQGRRARPRGGRRCRAATRAELRVPARPRRAS